MQVITVVQTKGGSGKTTTAMLLASAALNLGRRHPDRRRRECATRPLARQFRTGHLGGGTEARLAGEPGDPLATESVEGLLSLLGAEEARGVDLVVIDTRRAPTLTPRLLPDLRSRADPSPPRLCRVGNDPSRRPLDGRPPRFDCRR